MPHFVSDKDVTFLFQRGEEPDPSAKAAAGWGLSGFAPCRPGEGTKEKGGAGAEEARGGEGPTECSCWRAETTSESCFALMEIRDFFHVCILSFWLMLSLFQTLEEEKERKSECLPPEPPADDPESVKIVFKLPNDTRVERRFLFGQSLTVSITPICPCLIYLLLIIVLAKCQVSSKWCCVATWFSFLICFSHLIAVLIQ